ncbi:MAG: HEAT repeat domain-containing protein, partial [bacterium]
VPEAIGEILARRPEFQEQFLPVLCSMITHEDMLQTGAIERGVIWALGRIGPPVADCSSHAVTGIRHAIWNHVDEQTREVATWALTQINQVDSPEDSPKK